MDISDIMVTFWLSYSGEFYRVESINGNSVVLDTESGLCVDISECCPVELTPEILDESGFFGVKERFVFGSGTEMLILSYDSESGLWTMSISLHDTSIEMKYVHELQMALKSLKRSDIVIDIRRHNTELRKFNYARVGTVNRMLMERTDEGWILDGNLGETVSDSDVERIEMTDNVFKENKFVEKDSVYEYDMGDTGNGDFIVKYSEDGQWDIENKRSGKSFYGYIRFFNQLQNILEETGIPIDVVPDKTEREVAEMLDEAYK